MAHGVHFMKCGGEAVHLLLLDAVMDDLQTTYWAAISSVLEDYEDAYTTVEAVVPLAMERVAATNLVAAQGLTVEWVMKDYEKSAPGRPYRIANFRPTDYFVAVPVFILDNDDDDDVEED